MDYEDEVRQCLITGQRKSKNEKSLQNITKKIIRNNVNCIDRKYKNDSSNISGWMRYKRT